MSFCVYWIREQSHTDLMTQGYIGVSGNVERRFAAHRNMENGTNAYLRNAIQKYGWDNLIKSVLETGEKDYCLELEKKLRPADQIGWNLTVGGGFPPVTSGPQPHRKGRATWNKGKRGIFSVETLVVMRQKRLGVPPGNKGVPLTDDQKAKLSISLKGRPCPMKGKHHTPETVEKMRLAKLGTKASEQTKQKMSESQRNRPPRPPITEDQREKLGLLAKGRRWYNNGQHCVFCYEGQEPEGYVLGRKSTTFVKEN